MTENKKASEALLGELHGVLAKTWAKKLKEAPETLSPAELNAIRQFLKDNGISCDPSNNQDIKDMVDALPDFDKEELLNQ